MLPASEKPDFGAQEFATFYTGTEVGLRAYVRRCVPDSSIADDLVQESYVRLLASTKANLPGFEQKLYLYRIATNLIRNHWARGRRWEPLPDAVEDFPFSQAARESIVLDVRRALGHVSPRYRSILWLAYVEEYNHREIAAVLGINRLSVKVLLSRARKQMIAILEGKA